MLGVSLFGGITTLVGYIMEGRTTVEVYSLCGTKMRLSMRATQWGKGYIAIVGLHGKSSQRCCVVNVYAACTLKEKKILWEELSKCKENSQIGMWCFCGDFNAIRRRVERQRTNRGDFIKEMKEFNGFIETNLLMDLPIVGKKFTWFKSNGTTKSRIDRALVTEEWLQCWPTCKQYVQ